MTFECHTRPLAAIRSELNFFTPPDRTASLSLRQKIEVGPVSGESNVIYWLRTHNIEPAPSVVKAVYAKAKESKRILTKDEILAVVQTAGA